MNRMRTVVSLIAALIAISAFADPTFAAGTLDRIRQSGKVMFGYRAEARHFPIAMISGQCRRLFRRPMPGYRRRAEN